MSPAILELDCAIVAWSADSLGSYDLDRAHSILRPGDAVRAGGR